MAAGLFQHVVQQEQGQAQQAELFADAEEDHAVLAAHLAARLPVMPQGAQAQLAVEALEQGIEVRQGHHARGGLAVMEEEDEEIGVEQALELLHQHVGLAVGKGREAPVAGPRDAVEVQHDADVLGEGGLGGDAAGEALLLLEVTDLVLEPVLHPQLVALDEVGEQVLLLAHVPGFQQGGIVGRVPGHHERGGLVEAVHQHGAGVVGGRIEGPAHEGHALAAQPVMGGLQQGVGGLAVILAFEEAEGPAAFAGIGVVFFVHDGRDAAHGAAVAQGQEQFAPGGLPEGMLAGREQLAVLLFQVGHPEGIRRVDAPGQFDEAVQVFRSVDGDDAQFCHAGLHGADLQGLPYPVAVGSSGLAGPSRQAMGRGSKAGTGRSAPDKKHRAGERLTVPSRTGKGADVR